MASAVIERATRQRTDLRRGPPPARSRWNCQVLAPVTSPVRHSCPPCRQPVPLKVGRPLRRVKELLIAMGASASADA